MIFCIHVIFIIAGCQKPASSQREDIVRSSIKRSTLNAAPYELWNAYVYLLAISEYEEFSVEQRPAHLAFCYDAEVNNGGHLQYFENKGTVYLDETIAALKSIGADDHQKVLIRAKEVYFSKERDPIQTAQEFVDEALKGEYEDLDNAFYDIKLELHQILEKHLEANTELFVEIIEDI